MELGLRVSRGLLRANNLDCDAHRDDGKRFVVQAEEKLTAFVELESAIREARHHMVADLRRSSSLNFTRQ